MHPASWRLWLSSSMALVATLSLHAAPETGSWQGDVVPFLAKHCLSCHSDKKPKGGVVLDFGTTDEKGVVGKKQLWEKVADNLRSGDMPPPSKPRPTATELDAVNRWLDRAVFRVDCSGAKDPGRVTLRRLNRAEYNNTIRDLLGIDFHPADDFPSDDVGYGFDNIGDVLSMSPVLLEKYLGAAEKAVQQVWQNDKARARLLVVPLDERKKLESAQRIIRNIAEHAFRRPVNDNEVIRLLRLVELTERSGEKLDGGIRLALTAILTSPHFLFHVELDPRGKNGETSIHPISDFELASRLSYFLWSSMPDDELFRLARESKLHQSDVLANQVRRMLRDPKMQGLVDNFAGQWLNLRILRGFSPDAERFPGFDEALRQAMLKETESVFAYVAREDRSVLEFLSADYSFLNERLARHYGINGVRGEEFRKVDLQGSPRGGLLTQASVLTVTSNPTRTSPVKRGKWILENILGTPPPPPPPDVEPLQDDKEGAVLVGSLRQRMEQHRSKPACANCHERMDALGFGFENFDAIGMWRERDGKEKIDPAGTLPGGQSFQGPTELKNVLLGRKDLFVRCLSEKLLTYALGRGVERSDRCCIDGIARDVAEHDYRFSSVVLAVVRSDPFLKRKPPPKK